MPHLAKGAAAMKGIQGHGAHGRRLRADQAAREAPRRTDAVLPDANGTAGTVGPPTRLSTCRYRIHTLWWSGGKRIRWIKWAWILVRNVPTYLKLTVN